MTLLYRILRTALKLLLGKGVQKSYSQGGEDVLIASLLKKKTGVYVDVGAYHPILYSNTYGLYRRGWCGIAIDANPDLSIMYRIFRPRDTYVIAGIGERGDERRYFRFSDGAYNTFDPDEATERKGMKHLAFLGETNVSMKPLRDILRENRVTEVDLLTIDIEGLDIEALHSYDWEMPPTVIAVEDRKFDPHDPQRSDIYTYLHEKGYTLAAMAPLTLVFMRRSE